ncbi:MAG: hypothetical protein CBB67_003625 [Alteromonadaceae bacterium TMED7]|nr:hypothetical protein [Alteromonadaceae bacterium]MCP4057940.1 hypothetical protein [Pseudoalteromonas sp.]RPH21555.1 MAG: hypothetical protein CBB67_003625 [Alteromonadaceae bacterium TMED7]|tara:strand:- start:547 stop:813 length:267 start_codon:yes stop_codon:yes gene_type:complete
MLEKTLNIDMDRGNWMVNIINEHADNGIYELVSPARSATVHIHDNHIYGFEYSIVGKADSPFKIKLDDTVLAEGKVAASGISRGHGII